MFGKEGEARFCSADFQRPDNFEYAEWFATSWYEQSFPEIFRTDWVKRIVTERLAGYFLRMTHAKIHASYHANELERLPSFQPV